MDLVLDGESLSLEAVARFARDPNVRVRIAPAAMNAVRLARAGVEALIDSGAAVPAVTTGIGPLAEHRLSADQLLDLQRSFVRGRSAGLGAMLPAPETRLLMLLRANSLAKGVSGVRAETLDALVALINSRLVPAIPGKGSAGTGDRAPLAHLAAILMGEGTIIAEGRERPAAGALADAGLSPLALKPREAFAFVNGTELATAIGARVLIDARTIVREADVIAALTLEALVAPEGPFDPRVQHLRPHPGSQASARNLCKLRRSSALRGGQAGGPKPRRAGLARSARCTAQVHGAARDALDYVERVVAVELNAATDETFIFPARAAPGAEALPAGNSHGAPIALAFDVLSLALAHVGSIAERRTQKLVSAPESGFPAYLTPREPGLHTGLLEAQVTSAAFVAENRGFAAPASLDSLPATDLEDHASMGAAAALKARKVLRNLELIAAIEFIAAAQALEFHAPLRTSPPLEAVRAALRDFVPPLDEDRSITGDVGRAAALLRDGIVIRRAEEALREPIE